MNQVTLVGRLGKNPELRFTGKGTPVANFTLATNKYWTDANGDKHERTEWHKLVVYGKTAEFCAKSISKGDKVTVFGELQTRQWKDKNDATRETTEIVVNVIEAMTSKRSQSVAETSNLTSEDGETAYIEEKFQSVMGQDSDIPF